MAKLLKNINSSSLSYAEPNQRLISKTLTGRRSGRRHPKTMQRWCTKLRSMAVLHSTHKINHLSLSPSSSHRLLHSSQQVLHKPLAFAVVSSNSNPLFNASSGSLPSLLSQAVHASPLLPHISLIQVRHLTKKEYRTKMLKFKPRTPIKSKLKKTKMKCYSSFKGRFRIMKDGQIRRWHEGKRHNAHLKSKKSKRRLRQPAVVPAAYAKVMKKLNFMG